MKDATIILSLEKQLKESKLVITEKEKKLKETGERDANIIQTLKKDLKERKLKMNEMGERDAATIHSLQKDLKESKLVIYEMKTPTIQ